MGSIFSIVYKPERIDSATAYNRVRLEQATLVAGHGIEGDLKGGHPKRQLNVMSYETLQALGGDGFQVEPGQMGEQIIVSGFDVDALPGGSRVRLGADAVIEIVEPREGCDRFQVIQGKSPEAIQGRMGVIARVITGGAIQVGDAVAAVD